MLISSETGGKCDRHLFRSYTWQQLTWIQVSPEAYHRDTEDRLLPGASHIAGQALRRRQRQSPGWPVSHPLRNWCTHRALQETQLYFSCFLGPSLYPQLPLRWPWFFYSVFVASQTPPLPYREKGIEQSIIYCGRPSQAEPSGQGTSGDTCPVNRQKLLIGSSAWPSGKGEPGSSTRACVEGAHGSFLSRGHGLQPSFPIQRQGYG
jgi:hypothetical protein